MAKTIPIIDLSNLDEELVAHAVVKGSEEWGIFHVVNHGIPMDLIQRLKDVGTQFFELPETEKKAVAKQDGSKDFEGYTTNLKYVKGEVWTENLFHRIWPPTCINFDYWPKNPPQYREVIEEYTKETKKLSERILGYLSEGLGLPSEALIQGLGGESTEYVMRINNYPPDPKPDLTLGVPEHTDIIGITIIITNEVPGLQIFKDDHWLDVHYIPSSITVNIGDQIMAEQWKVQECVA
jgi:flavonol synthase